MKPKAKKVTKDTKKKAKDGDKPKTVSKTEPKKKPRKEAEPKKIPTNEGNKDLEEAASATSKANVMPKVEKSSISGKVIVRKTIIKDTKDDTQKAKKKVTCRSSKMSGSRKSKRIETKSKGTISKTIAMVRALRSESKCTKTLREKRQEIIENRKNKDKSQKQKQQFSAIDTVELTDSDIAEYRPKRRLRIISPRDSSPSNTFSPQNRREVLEEECEEVQGFISDEGDGLETFKDEDEDEKSTSVELSEWDEKDNPTPRLKVKLQLQKRKEALWKLALEVPTKKRKIDQEGADESGFEGDCSEAEEEVEEEEFMEEEVENKENFGEEEEDVEENEEENAECGNDKESTKSYVDPNA